MRPRNQDYMSSAETFVIRTENYSEKSKHDEFSVCDGLSKAALTYFEVFHRKRKQHYTHSRSTSVPRLTPTPPTPVPLALSTADAENAVWPSAANLTAQSSPLTATSTPTLFRFHPLSLHGNEA
ncbi:hypothetical protein J6590_040429 [Homalodisca vitripennis]|nr:hypothetical protein J6590_040429 [Homalodisca vitripennis]